MKRLSRRSFLTILGGLGTGGLAGTLGVAFGRDRRRGQAIATAASHRHRHHRPPTTTPPTTSPTTTTTGPQPATTSGADRWSNPRSWPNGVPGPGDVAVVAKPILLDLDAR